MGVSRRLASLLASGLAVVLAAGLGATGAGALGALGTQLVPAAAADVPPGLATADLLPSPQINGVAWKQVIVGSSVYVGGDFQTARPFGVAAGGPGEVARTNMLAYDLTSGTLDPTFAPAFNGKIDDMAVTPDQSKLVVVGNFTTVTMPGGTAQTRNRVAVFNLPVGGAPSGATLSAVAPSVDSEVSAVAATNGSIFLGGYFNKVGTTSRSRVASVSATTGAVQPFAVHIDNNWVQSMVVSPDGSQIVIAGSFTSVGGSTNPGHGLYRANATTGAKLPLPLNSVVYAGDTNANNTVSSGFMRLASDGTSFYGTAWDYSGNANTEGYFQAKWSDGSLVNLQDCHGDSYDVAPIGDIVYVSSHAHYCGNSGGFPQTEPTWTIWSATAWTRATGGTNTADIYGYRAHPGTPRPSLLPFLPQFVPGTYTGKSQSTWTVTGNSQYVLYGGEFTKVDGVSQQGLVRFGTRDVSPHAIGPRTQSGGAFAPTVHSTTTGNVHVSWPALWDRDGDTLTYQLYRNDSSTPIGGQGLQTQTAYQWNGHSMSFDDLGQTPGASVRYAVRVTDSDGNSVNSDWTTTTVASSDSQGAYGAQVLTDGATTYWPLDDTPAIKDWSGADNPNVGSGVTPDASGAITTNPGPDTSAAFNGSSNGEVIGQAPTLAPTTFSQEVWFKTTSTSGGVISGYGDQASGDSQRIYGLNKADRMISMDTAGHVLFGVMTSGVAYSGNRTVASPRAYNDGAWHQAVATLSPTGMILYVDGTRVGSSTRATSSNAIVYGGFWRLGGNFTTLNPSKYFSGSIDEFSVYPSVLSAAQVGDHYTKATGQTPDVSPTASFTAATSGLNVSVDGSASSDTDGTISSYTWDWGDGTSGTGRTAHHTYARAGTYTITLTVADNGGATDSTSKTVVAVVSALASDTFSRTVRHAWGSAPIGGLWTILGGYSRSGVSGGYGRLAVTSATTEGAVLKKVSATRAATTMSFTLNKAFVGKKAWAVSVALIGRRVGSSQYVARVAVYRKGVTRLTILRNGVAITRAYQVPRLSIRPGGHYWLSMYVTGTSPTRIYAKVWASNARQPGWQRGVVDRTAALQHPGSVGLYVSLPPRTKSSPMTMSVDSFSAR